MRRMKRIRHIIIPLFTLVTSSLFVACTSPGEPAPPDCTGDSISIIPTATRQTDPDLFNPPTPPDGGDDTTGCATPIPVDTVPAELGEQFVTTEVANLALGVANQDLAATAVGDDMLLWHCRH